MVSQGPTEASSLPPSRHGHFTGRARESIAAPPPPLAPMEKPACTPHTRRTLLLRAASMRVNSSPYAAEELADGLVALARSPRTATVNAVGWASERMALVKHLEHLALRRRSRRALVHAWSTWHASFAGVATHEHLTAIHASQYRRRALRRATLRWQWASQLSRATRAAHAAAAVAAEQLQSAEAERAQLQAELVRLTAAQHATQHEMRRGEVTLESTHSALERIIRREPPRTPLDPLRPSPPSSQTTPPSRELSRSSPSAQLLPPPTTPPPMQQTQQAQPQMQT